MYIFIDESGSFVTASKHNLWNCVVAYMVPEPETKKFTGALEELKKRTGVPNTKELKLRNLNEKNLIRFLTKLNLAEGIMFAVAIDSNQNSVEGIKHHQAMQAQKIVEHKDKMKYEAAREGLQILHDHVLALSPQLYVQLVCQVQLMTNVVSQGVLYFVQRFPANLSRFKWRIDQKNSNKTKFEDAFEKLTPTFLQTIGLKHPMIMLREADYSAFKRFEYDAKAAPTYLSDHYGLDVDTSDGVINIRKIVCEDIKFHDSQSTIGIQIADLLASTMRRCLRNGFQLNTQISEILGQLLVSPMKGTPPIEFLALTESSLCSTSTTLPTSATAYIPAVLMEKNTRPMLLDRLRYQRQTDQSLTKK